MKILRVSRTYIDSRRTRRTLICFGLTLALAVMLRSPATLSGDSLVATHHVEHYGVCGEVITVTNSIGHTGGLSALACKSILPEEWRFVSLSDHNAVQPDISPKFGTTGILEFIWIKPPLNPFSFSYEVSGPTDQEDTAKIISVVLFRRMGEERKVYFIPNPLILDED